MNEQEIERAVKSYGWTPKIFHNTILIRSKFDTWIIEKEYHAVILKHQNLKRNPTEKFIGHIHKTFVGGTVNDALKAIYSHDNYISKYKNNRGSSIIQKINALSK